MGEQPETTDLSLWCYMHPKEAAAKIRDAEAVLKNYSVSQIYGAAAREYFARTQPEKR